MSKKKVPTKTQLITWYMDTVLETGNDPKSVYIFCKANTIEESEFYKYFASFSVIKSEIFSLFYTNTMEVLQKSEDFNNYPSKEKLFSFYYTFFELLTANRSYVIHALQSEKNKLKIINVLQPLKKQFTEFIDSLDLDLLDFKSEKINSIQLKGIKEGAWIQFMGTLKYYLDDTSPAFEKTDLLIEKSVTATFDLLNTKPLDSLLDLGKFLYKETFQNS